MWKIYKKGTQKRNFPVICQHGVVDSSFTFTVNTPSQGLAFLLANLGFDVWLTNVRGNTFSKGHKRLDPSKDKEYWDFTYDEHSLYDLPAVTEYVKEKSSASKVFYVGHSQGTLQMFVKISDDVSFQNNFKAFFGLAPVLFMKHVNPLFSSC